MTTTFLRRLAAVSVACFLGLQAVAGELDIIAKARAYLGSEAALNAIKSVHYTGTLTVEEPGKPATQLAVDLFFQKPYRHRSQISAEQRIETTVLDDYEGWQKVQDPKDPSRWNMNLLNPDQIKSLRANVLENLSFFGGLEQRRVTLEDQGPANIDGIACRKVAFIHSPRISYYRYFNAATGQLVLTETQSGESIREQGSMVVEGVRFPQALVTVAKRPDGSEQKVLIHFEKVTLNETLDDRLFAVPSMGAQ